MEDRELKISRKETGYMVLDVEDAGEFVLVLGGKSEKDLHLQTLRLPYVIGWGNAPRNKSGYRQTGQTG